MTGCISLTMLAGCASTAPKMSSAPTASVTARGETVAVGTANADAADDPAIWRNPANPAASLIVGTDKKAGLHVYDMQGADRSFLDAGAVNNVDLRDMGEKGIVVAVSDRNDLLASKLAMFTLDPTTATLKPMGKIASGAGEAYGVCLYRAPAALYAFMVLKDGTINQIELDLSGASHTGRIVRTMKLATQSEGCAVDERTGRLYVAEEDVGLWRFDAAPDGPVAPVRIAAADGHQIVADAEGVAVVPEGDRGGYVVVSSQGDNAYALYRLDDESYVGRFRIAAGTIGAVEETDGIDIVAGDFGPGYPAGLMVAQDGINPPRAQNFKLVSWADVKQALGLQ
nr:phytase [Sphingomonas laterariae]